MILRSRSGTWIQDNGGGWSEIQIEREKSMKEADVLMGNINYSAVPFPRMYINRSAINNMAARHILMIKPSNKGGG